ncbi:MAG: 3-hydroxyacyl-CoA dehydrogenase/enoyl-CoA hydratase family protein [Flavobacteriales bacterium]|nr:3-hydroxyacyl-CoA dehydrogenase/enoyl-CoA hydratase family protein [Flavobacteriales bacterium]
MKRVIKHVTVLGSGIMGSGIACHFANIGVPVLLLDIVPRELNELEKKNKLTLEDKTVRNRIVYSNLQKAIKSSPSPIYHSSFVNRIAVGNFDDDLEKIKNSDWIIEVVVERLDIKKSVFEKVEKYRKEGTLVSSNTSGIPIHLMTEGRSEDFKKHFAGTHFFNPVRYLPLLEIIPTKDTSKEVVDFYMHYGDLFLGKTTVLCKDTPAFIANRVGVYSIMNLFHNVKELGLSIEEIDKLTGPVIGRPKSATFRTSDVVGLDTLVHVANGLKNSCPNDEKNNEFLIPDFVSKLMENNWLGSKTNQGFYKKIKNEDGTSEIHSLDLNTFEYNPIKKVSFATLENTKSIENLSKRYEVLINGKDKAGEFYRKIFGSLFAYVSHRIPEISDELYRIDDALKAGFGWEHGPFQIWDYIGVEKGVELAEKENSPVAEWIKEMVSVGNNSFYKVNLKGKREYYDVASQSYKLIPNQDNFIVLDAIREQKTVWSNSDVSVLDLGDGILNLEFHSKMNSIGNNVIIGINKAIDLAEKEYLGLVISNQGKNFSVGANLMMIFTLAVEQEYDDLYIAIKQFQDTLMRIRYSSIPVIACPHAMTFGGGCEVTLHADKVVATPETYIGLVEFGVGVIPGGGGTKELTKRVAQSFVKGDVEINRLREAYLTIAMAKVSTSAYEAYDTGIFEKGKDIVVVNRNRQIAEAKKQALLLAEAGYSKPISEKFKVLGKNAMGMFYVGSDQMVAGNYISEHDRLIANKLAHVMTGGNLSEPTMVSEQYLLDLERETFVSLCGERKTLERIQYMLTKGKALRN